jgi:hypothetical protein
MVDRTGNHPLTLIYSDVVSGPLAAAANPLQMKIA